MSDQNKRSVTSVKALSFSGKRSYWKEWSIKVLAYGRTKKWEKALTDKQASSDQKDEALNFLIMSLTGNAFIYVAHATDPYTVWQELCSEYEPKDDMDVYDLKESFTKCKLAHELENPSLWMKRLENINRRLFDIDPNDIKSENDLKVHVKANLPNKLYKVFMATNRKSFKSMTWEELKSDLKAFWRQTIRDDKDEEGFDEETEVEDVLATKEGKSEEVNFARKFKGRCNYCGEIGHKARDCHKKKKKKGRFDKSKIKCFKCGQMGHFASECKKNVKTEVNWHVRTIKNGDDVCIPVLGSNHDDDEDDGAGWNAVEKKKAVVPVAQVLKSNDIKVLGTTNQYEVLTCHDNDWKPNLPNKLTIDLTESEEESVDKLFDSDSSDDEKTADVGKNCHSSDVAKNEKKQMTTEVEVEIKDDKKNGGIHHVHFINLVDESRKNKSGQDKRKNRRKRSKNKKRKHYGEVRHDFYERKRKLRKSFEHISAQLKNFEHELSKKVSHEVAKLNHQLSMTLCSYDIALYHHRTHGKYRSNDVRNNICRSNESTCFRKKKFEKNYATTEKRFRKTVVNNFVENKTFQDKKLLLTDERWLLDSGSTIHVTNSDKYFFNVEKTDSIIVVGTGNTMRAKYKGTIVLAQSTSKEKLVLNNVLYVPNFNQNIISASLLLQQGYSLNGDKKELSLRKNGKSFRMKNDPGGSLYYFHGARSLRNKGTELFKRKNAACNNIEDTREMEFEKVMRKTDLIPTEKPVRKERRMDINQAHDSFGHVSEEKLRKFCKKHNIKLTGHMKTCVGCMEAKAKRKPVRKYAEKRATRPAQRIYVDTSGPYPRSLRKQRYWFKIVDDYSRKSWNYFMKARREVTAVLERFILMMKAQGHIVEMVRCDNAGEHKGQFPRMLKKYNIKMEKVAPNTPQHNGVVERGFTTDLWRLKAMMRQVGFTQGAKNMLWPYGVSVLEKIHNMSVTSANQEGKTPDELFGVNSPDIAYSLIEFGRIGYVTIRDKIRGKMKPRSHKCIMVGYADNHSSDTYMMYNPRTRQIILSRDIRWADFERPNAADDLSMYENREERNGHHNAGVPVIAIEDDITEQGGSNHDDDSTISGEVENESDESDQFNMESDTDDESAGISAGNGTNDAPIELDDNEIPENLHDEDINNEGDENRYENVEPSDTRRVTRSESRREQTKRVHRAMKNLDASYNPVARKRLRGTDNVAHKIYNTAIVSDPGEPTTVWEAMNGDKKKLWIPSIKSEVMNFIKRKSWKYVSVKEPIQAGRKLIPCKWVFKIKNEQDGSKRYKSRLCVKGFHQIPGVDYTESFSPVATEVTIQTLMLYTLWMYDKGWRCEMFDVEAAFLNAELETAMYLKWPEAMHELGFITKHQLDNECIKLVRSMYGNVDAALRWQKCFVKACTDPNGEIKCEQSKVDPCLLLKRNDKNEVVLLIVCYVDDVLMSGTKEEINKFKKNFKKLYNITELGRMKKHLGMWYEWKKDKNNETYIKVTMDSMIKEIIELYEQTTGKKVKEQVTPGYPNKWLLKLKDLSKIIKEKEYRSLIGKILYYVNKMDVGCSNAVRELAQHLDSPGEEHWKALGRLVGYLKTRIGKGRIIRKPLELRVVGWSDSDYAKAEDRKSIGGNM